MKTDTAKKIVTIEALLPLVEQLRATGKTIVTANGCFDIDHAGHVDGLEWAGKQGDVLIVGLNSDRSVRENKGGKRPILPEAERTRALAGFEAVDYVFVFDTKGPISWIERLRPNIHVKGPDSDKSPAFEPEKAAVEAHGGEVRLAPRVYNRSTTSIIDKVLATYEE